LNHHFIDRYADLDSPLHRLDAKSKLLAFTALIISVLFIPAGKGFLFFIYFFAVAVLTGLSQIPGSYIIKCMLASLPFIVFAGSAIPAIGFQGFWILFLRIILFFLLLILLINTTPFAELLRGLRKLGCPRIIATSLGFLYRYVFVLSGEAMRMKQALNCRSFAGPASGAGLKALVSFPRTALLRSLERTKGMHSAMSLRGFSGDFPVFSPRKFDFQDLAFVAGTALFVAWTWHMR